MRGPLPSFITHSMRSKFDDTWMSMLGLSVGTTPAIDMSPSLTKRARMSLAFVASTKSAIGAPIRRATQPAKTLPKLPVGTHAVTGPASARAVVT